MYLFYRETFAQVEPVAARAGAHREEAGAVLLSAGTNQGDERGLGDVLALYADQSSVRTGAGRRRLHAGVPAKPHQCRQPARIRRARLRRHQSLCAGVRDDARYPAHL